MKQYDEPLGMTEDEENPRDTLSATEELTKNQHPFKDELIRLKANIIYGYMANIMEKAANKDLSTCVLGVNELFAEMLQKEIGYLFNVYMERGACTSFESYAIDSWNIFVARCRAEIKDEKKELLQDFWNEDISVSRTLLSTETGNDNSNLYCIIKMVLYYVKSTVDIAASEKNLLCITLSEKFKRALGGFLKELRIIGFDNPDYEMKLAIFHYTTKENSIVPEVSDEHEVMPTSHNLVPHDYDDSNTERTLMRASQRSEKEANEKMVPSRYYEDGVPLSQRFYSNCYNCGFFGHFKADCPLKERPAKVVLPQPVFAIHHELKYRCPPPNNPNHFCFNCGEKGHKRGDCLKPLRKEKYCFLCNESGVTIKTCSTHGQWYEEQGGKFGAKSRDKRYQKCSLVLVPAQQLATTKNV